MRPSWSAPPAEPVAIVSNATGAIPDGSVPNAAGRSGSPTRLSNGMRGAIPYVA